MSLLAHQFEQLRGSVPCKEASCVSLLTMFAEHVRICQHYQLHALGMQYGHGLAADADN
jgi:hypothetical protein